VNAPSGQGKPAITSWNNNKTNNNSQALTINTSESVRFDATANQTITTWNWFKDNVNQNNNFDNFTASWSSAGTQTINVNATNSNGTSDIIIWTVTVNAPSGQGKPAITSWNNNKTNNNSQALTINTSESVRFDATANKTITTWNWFKDNVNQGNNFDNITASWSSAGTQTIKVNATNSNGTSDTIIWTVTVNAPPASGAPSITVSSPGSPINTITGATISFNITANQIVNITWYINGTSKQTNSSVKSAVYTNTSAVSGIWNVTAIANNTNGSVSQMWIWNVQSSDIQPPVITIFYPNNNSTISIFDRVISGSITDDSNINATLSINGEPNNAWTTKGNFSWIANYTAGQKTINITASDMYGNSNTTIIVVQVLPPLEVKNQNITNNSQFNITANATTGVDLALTTGNNSANVTVTINASTNASYFNASNIVNGIGRYSYINATGDTDNITSVTMTLFYNHSDLDKNGNGVITDVGDLNENTLTLYWYWDNTTGDHWLPLTAGVDYSGKLDKANKSGPKVTSVGRNKDGNYLNVTMNHFSLYSIAGTPIAASTGGGSSPGSSSGSGSSGGGGGGGASGENFSNIEATEKYDMQISKDALTSYRFTHAKNPIMFVNITGNTSLGMITASIEVLKGTSSLVKVPPEGLVYKNANIWVGTSGFATPKNIKEAFIKFRIDNAWMSANGVSAGDIVLMKWDGKGWINLETKVLSKDETNTYFEGKTNAFSPFAIVAKTAAAPKPTVTTPTPAGTPVITATATPVPTKKVPGFEIVLAIALVGLTAVVLRKRS
jgi:PGF-pre-PGF domain-containing protein